MCGPGDKARLSRVQPSPSSNMMPLGSIGVHVRPGFVQPHRTMSPYLRTRRLTNVIHPISALMIARPIMKWRRGALEATGLASHAP